MNRKWLSNQLFFLLLFGVAEQLEGSVLKEGQMLNKLLGV